MDFAELTLVLRNCITPRGLPPSLSQLAAKLELIHLERLAFLSSDEEDELCARRPLSLQLAMAECYLAPLATNTNGGEDRIVKFGKGL